MTTPEQPIPPTNRRTLLKVGVATAGVATVAGIWFNGFGDPSRRGRIEPTPEDMPATSFTEAELATLTAAQERLLPSDGPDSPGARDVSASRYLDALIDAGEMRDSSVQLIRWGLERLDRLAGQLGFAALKTAAQDDVLRKMEDVAEGVRWLRLVLEYTLEAFFGDPVHGGNTNQIGWKWARHRPGTPRPTQPGWTLRELDEHGKRK